MQENNNQVQQPTKNKNPNGEKIKNIKYQWKWLLISLKRK